VITVESIGEVLAKLDTIPPVTMVEVETRDANSAAIIARLGPGDCGFF